MPPRQGVADAIALSVVRHGATAGHALDPRSIAVWRSASERCRCSSPAARHSSSTFTIGAAQPEAATCDAPSSSCCCDTCPRVASIIRANSCRWRSPCPARVHTSCRPRTPDIAGRKRAVRGVPVQALSMLNIPLPGVAMPVGLSRAGNTRAQFAGGALPRFVDDSAEDRPWPGYAGAAGTGMHACGGRRWEPAARRPALARRRRGQ